MINFQPVMRVLRKSTSTLIAVVVAVGLLASAPCTLAETMTWTNGSGLWTTASAWTTNLTSGSDSNSLTGTNVTCVATGYVLTNITHCVGGIGGPAADDQGVFTNAANYTVTINLSTNVSVVTFSNAAPNTTATVTLNAGPSSSLSVTGRFRVGDGNAGTSIVVWAGGTLSNVNSGVVRGSTQIGSANTNGPGTLIVTNGTVVCENNVWMGTKDSVGKLIITGPGMVTNAPNQLVISGSTVNFGPRSAGSQLIITNGGKLFWGGEIRASSNATILVSGAGSYLYCSNEAPQSSCMSFGYPGFTLKSSLQTAGSRLIVSNGATVYSDGTISIGRSGSSYTTGTVVGVGSKMIVRGYDAFTPGPALGCLTLGVGSAGGDSNSLVVYDGGLVDVGGPFLSVGGGQDTNSTFLLGGTGAISTGLAIAVRNNTSAYDCRTVITNAALKCTKMTISGTNNSVTVQSKGILDVTVTGTAETNAISINSGRNVLWILGGTVKTYTGLDTNDFNVGNSNVVGSALIVSNGTVLSEGISIGNNAGYCTGLVMGAGSVVSNFSTLAGITNSINVGAGWGHDTASFLSGNYFAVTNGASLYNDGNFNIGASPTNVANSALFGGPGLQVTINNTGTINIGSGSNTFGNTLTVSNAYVTCDMLLVGGSGGVKTNYNNSLIFKGGTIAANYMKVQSSNNVTFAAGQLSVGQFASEVGANNSNEFVVGDGTSAAFFDMAPGSNYYDFGSPGFTVTNGATLRGSGTLSGTVTVLGTFVPGFAGTAGSIYCSNSLTFGTSTMEFDLGTSRDSVTVGGNLGLGTSTINVTALSGFAAGVYTLFTHTNVVSGTLSVGTMPGGFTAVVSNDLPNTPRILLKVTATGGGDSYSTWASHYGLSGGNALGTADPDGDGMNNTNEFLAGFNPTSSAAYLHITSITRSGNDVTVTYLGASGDTTYTGGPSSRTNVLDSTTGTPPSYTNNFVTAGQTNVLSSPTGLGQVATFVHTNGATGPARYYRVRVLVP